MKDDLQYTPSNTFDNYPFPPSYLKTHILSANGEAYFSHRSQMMRHRNQGLTDTYNRFHDPACTDADILDLRAAHAAMDAAVLAAYGWTDLSLEYDFILDYTDEDDEAEDDETGRPSRKKKPYRYRLPDTLQDEILGRLLALNQKQAREQGVLLDSQAPKVAPPSQPGDSKPRKSAPKSTGKGKQQKSVTDLPLFQ